MLFRSIEANTSFSYTVNASDNIGIDTYKINDTNNFAINPATGIITNNTVLPLGAFSLNISVNDTSNNTLSQIITITVADTTIPIWDDPLGDQNIEANTSFSYTVNASDNIGIDSYFINSTEDRLVGQASSSLSSP